MRRPRGGYPPPPLCSQLGAATAAGATPDRATGWCTCEPTGDKGCCWLNCQSSCCERRRKSLKGARGRLRVAWVDAGADVAGCTQGLPHAGKSLAHAIGNYCRQRPGKRDACPPHMETAPGRRPGWLKYLWRLLALGPRSMQGHGCGALQSQKKHASLYGTPPVPHNTGHHVCYTVPF